MRCPVTEILVSGGEACGVRLSDGHVITASQVVSGLGYRVTESLLPNAPSFVPTAPNSPDCATKQSLGFVMANIGLRGSPEKLGISVANVWTQPAAASNGYDATKGIDDFMLDPLGVPIEMVPAGITFPSLKDGEDHSNNGCEEPYHTCQILIAADYAWFEHHMLKETPQEAKGARHAPPHVTRADQEAYDALKEQWRQRLLAVLHLRFPGTKDHVAFCDISTPLTIENYMRPGRGAAIGLDVTPERFVDGDEIAELDMKHPRVRNLWRAGQDYLMCGQVLAACAGIICALRMLGPLATTRFVFRSIRLLLIG